MATRAINKLFRSLSDVGREFILREYNKRRVQPPDSIQEICAALYSNKGQALGTALAGEVVLAYSELDQAAKLEFFNLLLSDYSPDTELIQQSARNYCDSIDASALQDLISAVEPPRRELLSRINLAQNGTQTIVQMREDLLRLVREHPELEVVDYDFQHLLTSWFNPGFLELRTLDWNTPASILEKLIAYEAVHEMNGWEDLRRRLESDRRCFGFFHPALPDEPLIFVEVALVNGLAESIQAILSPKSQQTLSEQNEVDTAIFYSISNCQKGLRGISFGNFLIKRVVLKLQDQFPELKQFATLSPIPGFNRWLEKTLGNDQDEILSEDERESLNKLLGSDTLPEQSLWEDSKEILLELCAHYLYWEKRGLQPLDPVARFHLGNGASIEQLNWMGDTSERGIKQSCGILINYRYDLETVEVNHEQLINSGTIACSKAFLSLTKSR